MNVPISSRVREAIDPSPRRIPGRPLGAPGLALLASALIPAALSAGSYPLFGPEELTHRGGRPSAVTREFEAPVPGPGYTLELRAGAEGAPRPPSWAVVILNQRRVLVTRLHPRRPTVIAKDVALAQVNRLRVVLGGRRGAVTLAILGEDDDPPTIVATVSPAPNAAGWNAGAATVSFECDDAESGIESCTDPIVVDSEGANQLVTGTAVDRAGNSAAAAALVSVDATPPTLIVDAPVDGGEAARSPIQTSGFVSDSLSGVALAQVNGVPLALADGEFQQEVELSSGPNVLEYRAEDLAGNLTAVSVSVELTAPLLLLEVLSPGDGAIQQNSGWPLILRLTPPKGEFRVGVDVYDQYARDIVPPPQEHNAGTFPRAGQAALLVFEDPDGCLSFVNHEVTDSHRCDERNRISDDDEVYDCGDFPDAAPVCASGITLPCAATGSWATLTDIRCPDETALRFRPGEGVGRAGLPGLVLISDTGTGRITDGAGDWVAATNLASWDVVSYELKDGRGQFSITAHLNVPFGLFAPVVEYDECIGDPDDCGRSDFLYRIDGGPDLCPDPSSVDELCHIQFTGCCDLFEPDEPRVRNLYAPIFENKPITLRAFVVNLGPLGLEPRISDPFDEAGIAELPDENGDGIVDAADAVALGYELFSNEVRIHLDRRIYGNPCEGGEDGDPAQTPPFLSVDLDGNGQAIVDELFLFNPCRLADDSSPVGAGVPPP